MKPDIKDKIKLANRAAYLLIRAGVHGVNGLNPTVSVQVLNMQVVPRPLYGLEAVILSKEGITQISQVYRTLLKRYQSLPERAQTPAVHLLSGTLLLEVQLHILSLF